MGVADINPGSVTVGKDGNITDIALSGFAVTVSFIDFHFIVFVNVMGSDVLTVFYTGLFVPG